MATRSGAALTLVRDTTAKQSPAPARPSRKQRLATLSHAELVEHVAALELRLEGLSARFEQREREEAERRQADLETMDRQRAEMVRLLDIVIAQAKTASANPAPGSASERPKAPDWLRKYCLDKDGGIRATSEHGTSLVTWLSARERKRVLDALEKFRPEEFSRLADGASSPARSPYDSWPSALPAEGCTPT
jgi:hypothetical protein